MTDSVVIADILSRCLNIEVNYKGGVFQANCDFKTMETLLADESIKLDLFCFGISIIVKSDNEGFAVSNNGAFVGDMYLANELDDNMTDTGATAGILCKYLGVNVTIKSGKFYAHCDHDHLINIFNSASIKMNLFCFGISIFKKGTNKFAVTNDGIFISNLCAVNNDK